MKDFLKGIGVLLLLIIVGFGAYMVYLSFDPYYANNAIEAEKVAEKAAAQNDLEACSKIKFSPFFWEGVDITRNEIKALCYYKLAEIKKDKTICERMRPYTQGPNPDSYIQGCEEKAVITF